jgi:uncharacterized protein with beta-barrel porin domain
MSSLSDILTAAKNIVTAINGAAQTYLSVNGAQDAFNISSATLVKQGAGRIAVVSVTTAGSTTGSVYDANSATATTGKIYVIQNTVGITVVNMPVSFGIVVAPGSSQVVSISYS